MWSLLTGSRSSLSPNLSFRSSGLLASILPRVTNSQPSGPSNLTPCGSSPGCPFAAPPVTVLAVVLTHL
jgi:hypothetical protein